MRSAMLGADGKTDGVFAVLNKVPAFAKMKNDLVDTYEDAHELTMLSLQHEAGEFTALSKMNTLEGISSLDGWEDAIKEVNTVEGLGFPTDEIETMEDDLLA